MKQNTDHELDLYINAALGKKAINLVVLDVHELTSFTDTFIICSGRSNRQVNAIAISPNYPTDLTVFAASQSEDRRQRPDPLIESMTVPQIHRD